MTEPVALLLNTPAPKPTLRDYYCSSTSKGHTVWQPMDLIVQSGWLRDDFHLVLIDAAATQESTVDVVKRIERLKPSVTLGLIGAASLDSDIDFYEKAGPGLGRLFLSGDVARFKPAAVFSAVPRAEGILRDLACDGLKRFLAGDDPGFGLWLKGGPFGEDRDKGEFWYPVPDHGLFWGLPYRHPFLGRPFASVLTDHGCPFNCRFCNSGRPGWRRRSMDDLFRELDFIKSKGIRWLFIKDMTFNADAKRCTAILERLIEGDYRFRFAAYLRPDNIDAELAGLLARAGCCIAQLGIESGSDRMLDQQRKGITLEQIHKSCRALDDAGVAMGGHFVLGLEGETPEDRDSTLDLAVSLPLLYASFNLATPRYGSMLEPDGELQAMDGSRAVKDVSEELLAFRRKAILKFYGDPKRWVRAIKASPAGVLDLAAGGMALLRSSFGTRDSSSGVVK